MQVSWSVRENNFRDEVEASQGIITFSSGVRETDLVIGLRDDNVSRYLIILHLLSFIISFNRPFARWRHFTSTIRILFVFPFIFKFFNPSEVWITKALISTRKQNPWRILVVVVKWCHRANGLLSYCWTGLFLPFFGPYFPWVLHNTETGVLILKGATSRYCLSFWKAKTFFRWIEIQKSLSILLSYPHQLSPNNINTSSRENNMRIKKWSKWPNIKCVNFFYQIFTTNSLKNCVEISVENLDIGALLKKGYGVKGLEFTERNFKYKPAFKTYFLLTVHQDDLFSLQFEL